MGKNEAIQEGAAWGKEDTGQADSHTPSKHCTFLHLSHPFSRLLICQSPSRCCGSHESRNRHVFISSVKQLVATVSKIFINICSTDGYMGAEIKLRELKGLAKVTTRTYEVGSWEPNTSSTNSKPRNLKHCVMLDSDIQMLRERRYKGVPFPIR